jgi:hypothetical protein
MKPAADHSPLSIPPDLLAEIQAQAGHRPAGDVLREKIAQGVRSLREGRVIDGPAFMARMDTELAELERQGH